MQIHPHCALPTSSPTLPRLNSIRLPLQALHQRTLPRLPRSPFPQHLRQRRLQSRPQLKSASSERASIESPCGSYSAHDKPANPSNGAISNTPPAASPATPPSLTSPAPALPPADTAPQPNEVIDQFLTDNWDPRSAGSKQLPSAIPLRLSLRILFHRQQKIHRLRKHKTENPCKARRMTMVFNRSIRQCRTLHRVRRARNLQWKQKRRLLAPESLCKRTAHPKPIGRNNDKATARWIGVKPDAVTNKPAAQPTTKPAPQAATNPGSKNVTAPTKETDPREPTPKAAPAKPKSTKQTPPASSNAGSPKNSSQAQSRPMWVRRRACGKGCTQSQSIQPFITSRQASHDSARS